MNGEQVRTHKRESGLPREHRNWKRKSTRRGTSQNLRGDSNLEEASNLVEKSARNR